MKFFLVLLLALSPSFALNGQQPQVSRAGEPNGKVTLASSARVSTHRLSSRLMGREVPFRVLLPGSYDTAGERRYPVVYLLHGLFGSFENWADKTRLVDHSARHEMIIVMPEGGNGWYTDSAADPSAKYESYIVKELLPEIDKRFRTIVDRRGRMIAGLSMGGYGAIKFGLKFPEFFNLAGSFSGALGAASFTEAGRGAIGKSIDGIFGAVGSETRKSNDIFRIVREMPDERVKTLPFLYLDCGTEDFLFQNNRDFADLLLKKRIPHEFRQLPGGHTWTYWDSQLREFLALAGSRR